MAANRLCPGNRLPRIVLLFTSLFLLTSLYFILSSWKGFPTCAVPLQPLLNPPEVMTSRSAQGWNRVQCDQQRKLRCVSIRTKVSRLHFYVYDSAKDDRTATYRALQGYYSEKEEIQKFLELSADLPLIDVGANLGIVTLQAALQGRSVVAVEPVPENALRLCRSVLDFGHASLVHVIQNAVTSSEGEVTLDNFKLGSTIFEVVTNGTGSRGGGAVRAYGVLLDQLLEVISFKSAALKIDVESHEGKVMAGSERLFREVNIPMVWMEWEHVKLKPEFGAKFVMDFMGRRDYLPHDLMTGRRLQPVKYMLWPWTVLWLKKDG